jgi:hypothetical protein
MSAVYRGFEPRSGQTKDYKIGMCCFSTKNTALRRKSKDWLARNRDNLSEWSDISTRGLLLFFFKQSRRFFKHFHTMSVWDIYSGHISSKTMLSTVVSVDKHYKNRTKCVGLVQIGPHHHLIES